MHVLGIGMMIGVVAAGLQEADGPEIAGRGCERMPLAHLPERGLGDLLAVGVAGPVVLAR